MKNPWLSKYPGYWIIFSCKCHQSGCSYWSLKCLLIFFFSANEENSQNIRLTIYFSIPLNWFEARNFCVERGEDLYDGPLDKIYEFNPIRQLWVGLRKHKLQYQGRHVNIYVYRHMYKIINYTNVHWLYVIYGELYHLLFTKSMRKGFSNFQNFIPLRNHSTHLDHGCSRPKHVSCPPWEVSTL